MERATYRKIHEGWKTPMMETIAHQSFRWKPVDIVINEQTNLKYIELKDKIYNIYGCGTSPLDNKMYINHVKVKHKGFAQPKSQLNCPVLYDFVAFRTEEDEQLFLFEPPQGESKKE